jgi:hypothetical protein
MAKPGTLAQAPRQVSSVTPKFSSMCSERGQPGVTPTAVTGWPVSSAARPITIRLNATFAAKKVLAERGLLPVGTQEPDGAG